MIGSFHFRASSFSLRTVQEKRIEDLAKNAADAFLCQAFGFDIAFQHQSGDDGAEGKDRKVNIGLFLPA